MPFESPIRESFQKRVIKWVIKTFGKENAYNVSERSHRFIEEAIELVQATGMTRRQVNKMVDYVYERDEGNPEQEIGGVKMCLSALSNALDIDDESAGEKELKRVENKIMEIRDKNKSKPTFK